MYIDSTGEGEEQNKWSEEKEITALRRDLMNRKEFAFLFSVDEGGLTAEGIYKKQQLFVANFANFNTPYSRLLVKHGTGTGKTMAGLLVARSFLEKGKRVVILGQNKDRFFNEMVSSPQLGFVTKETTERYADILSR
jgi:Rad3-related DNA helicase